MLLARDPCREVTVEREMLKRELFWPNRRRAEKAELMLPMLLSVGAIDGVGAEDAR